MKEKRTIILTGAVIGILAVALVFFGNPKNMGICVACFLRDIAGGLGLHKAAAVQYLRPEIIGIILGSFGMALFGREFKAKGGSATVIRFVIGVFIAIGALMFLGCPLRMILRLAGGDLNALFGLAGFTVGILIGVFFLNKGFSLKRNKTLPQVAGYSIPAVFAVLLALLLLAPSFIYFSQKGPGSMHAAIWISLGAGLIVGALGQRSRMCMAGGIRDLVLFKDAHLISGFVAILVFALAGNLLMDSFKLGFVDQPIAHMDGLWNFLGMVLVGWGAILLGGCPFRQLVLAGEGNLDSFATILGIICGGALAHTINLASSVKGPTPNGKIAVLVGLAVVLLISYFMREKSGNIKMKEGVKIG